MTDHINYSYLLRGTPQYGEPLHPATLAANLGKALKKIDPNGDGIFTKTEFTRNYRLLSWNKLLNAKMFIQQFKRWKAKPNTVSSSRLRQLASRVFPRSRDLTSASVKRALDCIYVGVPTSYITQFKPRGDSPGSYLYTFEIGWRSDWGVLHFRRTTTIHFENRYPIVEYKVNSIQGKIAVVTILTADGSKTVLRGNIKRPDLFAIVKNPTHARIKRTCTPGVNGCGGTVRLPGCGAII